MSKNEYFPEHGGLKTLEREKTSIVIRKEKNANSIFFTMMHDAKYFHLDIEFDSEQEMEIFFKEQAEKKADELYKIFVN